MASKCVKRITLFKSPTEDNIDYIIAQYDILRKNAVKDGKPYVLSLDVGRIQNTSEERSRGYTIAVQSTFASREDYEYYDKTCEAHKAFKASVVGKHEGASQTLMVWFDSDRPGS